PPRSTLFPYTTLFRSAKGATVEFNKMEGININYAGAASGAVPFMYVAMADVAGAMADTEGDIQVDANRCGIVYRLGLHADYNVSDRKSTRLNSSHVKI